MLYYQVLDIAILVLHSCIIGFNCFGMWWKKTRLANLVLLTLTGLSWTVLGARYGWGYCPVTDWHWAVKRELGVTDLPRSYVKWMIDAPTGWDVPAVWADAFAVVVFVTACALSLGLNGRDWWRKQAV